MKKTVFLDAVTFMASILFFSAIAIFLMIIYVLTFRRKDDSLLPG